MPIYTDRLIADVEANVGKAIAELKRLEEAGDDATKTKTGLIVIETQYDKDIGQSVIQQMRETEVAGRRAATGLDAVERSAKRTGGAIGSLTDRLNRVNISFKFLGILMKPALYLAVASAVVSAASAITALGAGVVGLVSALQPLTGLLAALPQGFALLGQSAAAALLGFSRVTGALKAQKQAQDAAEKSTLKGADTAAKLARAQREVEDATRGVAEANKDVERAQLKVNEARLELNDLLSGAARERELAANQYTLERAEIAVQRSTERLSDAQKRLNDLMKPKDPVDMAEAELKVAEAREELYRVTNFGTGSAVELQAAQVALAKAEQDLNKLKTGPTAEELAAAQLDVKDATLGVKEAQEDQIKTTAEFNRINAIGSENSKEVIDARTNLISAEETLSDATWQVIQRQQALDDANARVTDSTNDTAAATAKFKQAYDELSPAGKRFVDFVDTQLRPKLKELQAVAEEGLLDGLRVGIQNAMPLFPTLKSAIGDMAGAIGGVFTDLGKLMGSPFFVGKFKDISDSNVGIMENSLGPAFINFASGITSLMHAARPLTEWLGTLVLKLSEVFQKWAEGKDAMGTGAFADTISVLKQLGDIFGDIGAGFGNVFKAARPLGDWMLERIAAITQKFREWTGEAENMTKMTDFFNSAKAPISEIMGLLGDIVKSIFTISAGTPEDGFKGMQDVTETARTLRDILPSIESALVTLRNSKFFDELAKALEKAMPALETLVASGTLTKLVTLFGDLAGAISDVIVWIGPENMAKLAGLYGSIKALSIAGSIGKKGITKLFAPFKTLKGWADKFTGKGKLLDCTSAVTCTETTAGKVGKLGGVFETFKTKVDDVGKKMGPIFGKMANGAKGLGPKIGTALAGVIPAIGGAMAAMGSAIMSAGAAVMGVMFPWGLIILAALAIGVVIWKNREKIGEFIGKIPGWILGFFDKAIDWLYDVGKTILEGAFKGLKWIWEHTFPGILITYKDEIIGFFDKAWDWLFEAGKKILEGLWKGIQWIWNNVILGAFNVAKWIGDKFLNAGTWLFEKGKEVLDGLWQGLKNIWEGAQGVASWFGKIIGDVVGWFTELPGKLKEGAGGVFDFLLDSIKSVLRKVIEAWNSLDLGFTVPDIVGVPHRGEKFDIFPDFKIPGFLQARKGGIFPAKKGGWMVNLGEAGEDEAVIPLRKLPSILGAGGGGRTINNYITVEGSVIRERELAEKVRQHNIQTGRKNASAYGRYA